MITQADSDKTFTLTKGASAELRLSQLAWSKPTVTGGAVTLSQIQFVRDPGYQAWRISAVAPGQAVIKAIGAPLCPPGGACPTYRQQVSFSIVVS